MDEIKVSKFLAKHLRHDPQGLGLTLEEGGWVRVDDLLAGCARKRFPITRAQLEQVVANNSKQRFSFDARRERIRANQGHSVEVDLQLQPTPPPALLYHGTPQQSVETVMKEGLKKMSRHHVHLSPDVETATKVGQRRGKPVILEVDSGRMGADGYVFYVSDNGVWLTDAVPPQYLRRL